MKRTKVKETAKKRDYTPSHKGKNITADYIPYEIAMIEGNKLLWGNKPVLGFYILTAINTGLRISDTLALKHTDFYGKKAGDTIQVQEGKTKKVRTIVLNQKLVTAYADFRKQQIKRGKYDPAGHLFMSKKGVYRVESINTYLKQIFAGRVQNISSHSLRKSFGRHVYEMNNESEHALMLLSDIFQHSSISITRRYLGLRKEEIDNVYLNL